jgi:hypothetical protein
MEQKWRHHHHRSGASARPTWWVLLAVSMAVMALIFSRSGGTTHKAGVSNSLERSDDRSRATEPNPETPQTPALVRAATTPNVLPSSSTSPVQSHDTGRQPPSSAMPILPTTTTTVMPTIESLRGYLTYPENVVSSYPIVGTGRDVTASATWSGQTTLDLSINCSEDQRSVRGTSTASVSIAVSSPCTVNLTDEGLSTVPVIYDLTITMSPA